MRRAMIDWGPLLNIAALWLLGAISPGPNFMAVAHQALNHGRSYALTAVLGVALVSTMWATASLFGLALIFKAFPVTQLILRLAGSAYLVWLGIRFWRMAGRSPRESVANEAAGHSLSDAFRAGLATNLSNVRSISFYSSAFAAAAPSHAQTATLWATVVLIFLLAMSWYGTVALLLSTGPLASAYRQRKLWIDRLSGTLMIYFGVRLALS
jgi:threonine efflux protein